MAGKYARPPKYSTDRLKDADTIKALMATGVSGPTAFEMFGLNWEDEQELRHACQIFLAAQGIDAAGSPTSVQGQPPTPAPDDPGAEPLPEDQPAASTPRWRKLLSIFRSKVAA